MKDKSRKGEEHRKIGLGKNNEKDLISTNYTASHFR
jgi:hypothetical protein